MSLSKSLDDRINRLLVPYHDEIKFINSLNSIDKVTDEQIFKFFSNNDFSKKGRNRKIDGSLRSLNTFFLNKSLSNDLKEKLRKSIHEMHKIKEFIELHSAPYNAMVKYCQIVSYYKNVNEYDSSLDDIIINNPESLGLPPKNSRSLYQFIKTLDGDVRNLRALWSKDELPQELETKIKAIQVKLLSVKNRLVPNPLYKDQLSRTRWIKSAGIIGFIIVFVVPLLYTILFSVTTSAVAPSLFIIATACIAVGIAGVTIKVKKTHERAKNKTELCQDLKFV